MFNDLTKRLLSKKKKCLTYTNHTNIAVFGSSNVGKTTIIRSFASSIYGSVTTFKPTITECHERKITLKSQDGKVCKHDVSVLDTSGNLRYDFPSVYRQSIKNCEAFVLVFSMNDPESLIELEYILQDIDSVKKTHNTPVMIIANKSDEVNKNSDQVKTLRNKVAYLNRGCCFEKCATDEDYTDCFVSLLTKIEKRKGIDRSFYGVQIVSEESKRTDY